MNLPGKEVHGQPAKVQDVMPENAGEYRYLINIADSQSWLVKEEQIVPDTEYKPRQWSAGNTRVTKPRTLEHVMNCIDMLQKDLDMLRGVVHELQEQDGSKYPEPDPED